MIKRVPPVQMKGSAYAAPAFYREYRIGGMKRREVKERSSVKVKIVMYELK